jgi:choline dehydrogenase-like flavoprotein
VRIADASVMPDVARGKTNIPTIHAGRKTCERNRTSLERIPPDVDQA